METSVRQGEDQRRERLLIGGFDAQDVLTNALGLLRLIQEPIANGFPQGRRNRLGREGFQFPHRITPFDLGRRVE